MGNPLALQIAGFWQTHLQDLPLGKQKDNCWAAVSSQTTTERISFVRANERDGFAYVEQLHTNHKRHWHDCANANFNQPKPLRSVFVQN
jgi:hypothetical protein